LVLVDLLIIGWKGIKQNAHEYMELANSLTSVCECVQYLRLLGDNQCL
jgi:hypothetical protein